MNFENRLLCEEAVRAGVEGLPPSERLNNAVNTMQKAIYQLSESTSILSDIIEQTTQDLADVENNLLQISRSLEKCIIRSQRYEPHYPD